MKKMFKGCLTTIIIVLLIIILLVAALIIFRIPIADYLIETFGSTVAGAKVEVDGVYLEPFKLQITWERLQFTDKNDTWKIRSPAKDSHAEIPKACCEIIKR